MAGAACGRRMPLLLCLAAFGSLPSCITSGLWQDNRTRRRLDEVEVHTPSVVDPTQRQWNAVFDAHGTDLVAKLLPGSTQGWVRLEPVAHAESVRTILGGGPRQWGVIELLTEPEPGVDRLSLRLWLGVVDRLPAGWGDLPGVRRRWSYKGTIAELHVPCALATAAPPAAEWPAAGLHRLYVRRIEVLDDDHAAAVKALLTPVTVLMDVLILPVELLTIPWWW